MSENAGGLRKVLKMHEVTWKKKMQWEENAVLLGENRAPSPRLREGSTRRRSSVPGREQAGQAWHLTGEPRCERELHRASLALGLVLLGQPGSGAAQEASEASSPGRPCSWVFWFESLQRIPCPLGNVVIILVGS